jgi:hypothetical protein
MAVIRLDYPSYVNDLVQRRLREEPGLKRFYERLVNAVETNPEQSSPELFVLSSGKKVMCRKKSVRASSYSKKMIFSKDEIVMLYEILPDRIRVISVYFP